MSMEEAHESLLCVESDILSAVVCLIDFRDRAILCSAGWSWTYYVTQADLELAAYSCRSFSSSGLTGANHHIYLEILLLLFSCFLKILS